MRIALCTDRYLPAEGGVERYVDSIAGALAKRHKVTVFAALSDEGSYRELCARSDSNTSVSRIRDPRGFDVVWVVPRCRAYLSLLLKAETLIYSAPKALYHQLTTFLHERTARCLSWQLRAELRDQDVVHSMAPWQMARAARRAARLKPHVATGFIHEGFWADDSYSVRHFSSCSKLVALSATEKAVYQRKGIAPERIAVIPVPEPYLSQESSPQGVWAGARGSEQTVLYLGAKREYKGLDLILRVAKQFARERPKVRFVFAGPRTPFSEALFASVRSESNVVELGHITDQEKIALLRYCSVLCLPSATEIMPTVILEAWREGIPVIASNIPTLEDFVGIAGRLVLRDSAALANALRELLDNPSLRQDLIERGRNRLKSRHCPYSIANALEQIYEQAAL